MKTELQHLDHRHAAGLALGGEQAVQTGGSRQTGQAEGQHPQARLQLRFIQPKRRHRPAEGIEQRARAQPQAKGIAQAQLHNAAPAAAVADTDLQHQPRGGKPYPGDGQSGSQAVYRHQQFKQTDARRADAPGEIDLKAHGQQPHEQGGSCQ